MTPIAGQNGPVPDERRGFRKAEATTDATMARLADTLHSNPCGLEQHLGDTGVTFSTAPSRACHSRVTDRRANDRS
jgi:hypothetical protein